MISISMHILKATKRYSAKEKKHTDSTRGITRFKIIVKISLREKILLFYTVSSPRIQTMI